MNLTNLIESWQLNLTFFKRFKNKFKLKYFWNFSLQKQNNNNFNTTNIKCTVIFLNLNELHFWYVYRYNILVDYIEHYMTLN